MKLLFGAVAWFFLGIAFVLAVVGGFQWSFAAEQVNLTSVLPFFAAANQTEVLGVSQTEEAYVTATSEPDIPLETELEVGDARPQLVARFLERYNSPLQPYDEYGQFFVDLADQHGFDFRLLPAISMQESGLCKAIPPGSYNCLGLGVHKRGTWEFESYKANFEAAAKILKKNYIDIGLTTPVEIMSKYTPSSNGSWANSVNQWMAEMRYDDRSLGRELKTDTSVLEFAQPSPTVNSTDAE